MRLKKFLAQSGAISVKSLFKVSGTNYRCESGLSITEMVRYMSILSRRNLSRSYA